MLKSLTDAQTARYRRDGFHFPLPVLSAAEARSYGDRLEAQERALGGPLSGNITAPAGPNSVRRRALLAALCVTTPLEVRGQTPPSAEAFLRDLYAPYLTGANQGQNYWDLERYFAADLARLMDAEARDARRRNEVPLLDGDPFVDAQEWDVKNLTLSVKTDGSSATAVVTFDNYGKAKRITLELVLTPAGWRISDIKAPSGSLRALFK